MSSDQIDSEIQVCLWRDWVKLTPILREAHGLPALPTLDQVTAEDRDYFRGKGGFFVFFRGEQGGYTLELKPRAPGQDITSWRPGCVAIREDGAPGAWLAVGGNYMRGADGWEKIA
jgi:hypothetical protein